MQIFTGYFNASFMSDEQRVYGFKPTNEALVCQNIVNAHKKALEALCVHS